MFNQFTTMPYIPYKIIVALTTNENLFNLLAYNSYDALSRPHLLLEEKLQMIWKGQSNMKDFNIILSNVMADELTDSQTYLKCYRYQTVPKNNLTAKVYYEFDVLYGTKNAIVEYNGVPCSRGDLIEMELMKSLNGQDVAGAGFLRFVPNCKSVNGIGNNNTFTGYSILFMTEVIEPQAEVCP